MAHYKNRKPKAIKGCCGMCGHPRNGRAADSMQFRGRKFKSTTIREMRADEEIREYFELELVTDEMGGVNECYLL